METMKFKTNIKCANCVAKVTPALNKLAGEGNWVVDLQDPNRTLSLKGMGDKNEINKALEGVGYKVESI